MHKRGKSIDPSCSTARDVTANNFSRRYFQMCFAGPSMGNSADADQMAPDVAFHPGLHC